MKCTALLLSIASVAMTIHAEARAQARITGDVQWILPAYHASGSLDGPRDSALLDSVDAMIALPGNEVLVTSTPLFGDLSLRHVNDEGTVTTLATVPSHKLRLALPRIEPDAQGGVFYALADGSPQQSLYALSGTGELRVLAGAPDAEFGALEPHRRYTAFSGNVRDGFWLLNRENGSVRYLRKGQAPVDLRIDVDEPGWHATSADAIAAGPQQSVWVGDDGGKDKSRILRIDLDGSVRARFDLPLGTASTDPEIERFRHLRMTSQHDGGVLLIDGVKQLAVRLNADASVGWQRTLCDGPPSADCNLRSADRGYLGAFRAIAFADNDQAWYASDGQRLFRHAAGQQPQWITGRRGACDRAAGRAPAAAASGFAPCFDVHYAAIPLGDHRYLWASRYDAQSYLFHMSLQPQGGETTVAAFAPAPYSAETMSDEVRAAMSDVLNGPAGHRLAGDRMDTSLGWTIAADGFVLPGGRLAPRDHPLTFASEVEWARLGKQQVLIADKRESHTWLYDLKTRRLSAHPVALKLAAPGMPLMPALQHGPETWMGNDPQGRALLVDSKEGVLREITGDLNVMPIARLPGYGGEPGDCSRVGTVVGSGSAHWIQSVAQDSAGRWWLATRNGGLFLQHGREFIALHTDAGKGTRIGPLPGSFAEIHQLIPGGHGEMIVVAADGIAKVRARIEVQQDTSPATVAINRSCEGGKP